MDDVTVAYNPALEWYELHKGPDRVGYATARRRGGVVTMPHVEIDSAYRGRNYANLLVRGALDDIAARNERVVALCPFVVAFLRRNARYQTLVA